MTSRFVNLVVNHVNGRQAPFSIHRINPANLFYPTGSPVPTQGSDQVTAMVDVLLPPAQISYEWPSTQGQQISMDFMAFGRNRDKVVGMDSVGRTFIYDMASRCLQTNLPNIPHSVVEPMSVAIGDNGLFVVSDIEPLFVALMDGCNPNSIYLAKPNWYWKSLPQPPFGSRSCKISAYTVVGNSQIWVSVVGLGTFSFDLQNGAWNKAGEWMMPFRGRVEYVPHNLWFGFSHNNKHLCASDLTAVSTAWPPAPRTLWRDLVWPEHWKLSSTQHLLPLGSGKLCIARFFRTSEEDMSGCCCCCKPDIINNFVVLAGVEVVYRQGNLQFIKHKSQRYSLGRDFADPL